MRCENLASETHHRLRTPLLVIPIAFAAFILSISIAYGQAFKAADLSTPRKAAQLFDDALAHNEMAKARSLAVGDDNQFANAKLAIDLQHVMYRFDVARTKHFHPTEKTADYKELWEKASETVTGNKAIVSTLTGPSFDLQKIGESWQIDLRSSAQFSTSKSFEAQLAAVTDEVTEKLENGLFKSEEELTAYFESKLAPVMKDTWDRQTAPSPQPPPNNQKRLTEAPTDSRAIQVKEKDASTFVTSGDAKFEESDWDGAIADYSRAIELDPKNARACRSRGYVKAKKKDWDGAIADYSRAIELEPNSEAAYSNRGIMKTEKKDWDGAIADYSRAIELDPKYVNNYNSRGYARKQKKDWDGAIADYSRAIELDPKFAVAYKNRGTVKREKKDWDGAIADYSRAIELDPKNASAYSSRGTMKMEKKDWDGAIADYNHAIEFGDKDAMIYVWRGLAHIGLSDNASGKEEQTRQSIAAVDSTPSPPPP